MIPGTPWPPRAVTLLLKECEHDIHARSALRAYATSVRPDDRTLANFIVAKLHEIAR